MAKKKRHRRRVSSPKRRSPHKRRRIGYATKSVIGSHRRHKKRRRMGAPGDGGAIMEYIMLTVGTGLGLGVGEIGGGFMEPLMPEFALAGIKAVAGGATFAVGRSLMKNNSLVKGIGIGLTGAAINTGLRYIRKQIPMLNGPDDMKDMYVVLPKLDADKSVIGDPKMQLYGPNLQLYPAKVGVQKSVIGNNMMKMYGEGDMEWANH
jgi:hypothetical protein